MRLVLVAAALFLGLAGCSQPRSVTARPDLYKGPYRTAYLVVKPDQGKDMQQHFERALQGQGLAVVTGSSDTPTQQVDVIVRFNDRWFWDLVMYLQSLHIEMTDARSNVLLASGDWANSAFHGFPNTAGVVTGLVNEMFIKLGAEPAQRQGP